MAAKWTMVIQCHKTYTTFLNRNLISPALLSWLTTFYGIDSQSLYDDIIKAIRDNEEKTDLALTKVPYYLEEQLKGLLDDICNNTILYFNVAYKTYDNYEDAFKDFMKTTTMTPVEVIEMVQDMLKQRNYEVELDHDTITVLFEKIDTTDGSISKYDPSEQPTAFIASINLKKKDIEELLKGTQFKKEYGDIVDNSKYDHLNTSQNNKVAHNMNLANGRLMDICDFMIIPNPPDMKDYIMRSIFLEAVHMIEQEKSVYVLNQYAPTSYWGKALAELNDILSIINGDLSLIKESRIGVSAELFRIHVVI